MMCCIFQVMTLESSVGSEITDIKQVISAQYSNTTAYILQVNMAVQSSVSTLDNRIQVQLDGISKMSGPQGPQGPQGPPVSTYLSSSIIH